MNGLSFVTELMLVMSSKKRIPLYRTPSTKIDSLNPIPVFSLPFSTIFLNNLLIVLECVDQMVSKEKLQACCIWMGSFPKTMNDYLNIMGQ